MPEPVIANAAGRPREAFDNPARGNARWVRFFSSDVTPTTDMSTGLMEVAPHDGILVPHRHAQAEVYFITEGSGLLTIDGVERPVVAGDAIFIPGDALHGIRNIAATLLKVFYVFPTQSFAEIIYRFPDEA